MPNMSDQDSNLFLINWILSYLTKPNESTRVLKQVIM